MPVSYAPLGIPFRDLDHTSTEQIVSEIALLTPLWRDAGFENSPLHSLSQFRTDESALADFGRGFARLRDAERKREVVLAEQSKFFDVANPDALREWLEANEGALRGASAEVTGLLARWAELMTPLAADSPSAAEQLIPWLEQAEARLRVLNRMGVRTRGVRSTRDSG